ncbi:MAG: ZIP family metal transporter [Cytophagales bacterium]|nr:ZIP family metal transporter [Armatimonadota bacterium]
MGEAIMLETGIATLVAVLGGAVAIAVAGRHSAVYRRRLRILVSLAAGALLAVTLVSILPEAGENLSLAALLLAAASGGALYYLVGRFLFPICPACTSGGDAPGLSKGQPHVHSDLCSHGSIAAEVGVPHSHQHRRSGNRLRNAATLLGLMVAAHAAVDGVAIATGHHAPRSDGGILPPATSLPLLVALSLHKLPEGLALAALLLGGGYRRLPAFLLTLGIELTTLLGGAIGVSLLQVASPASLSAITAHIGGGFLYLALQALGSRDPEETVGPRIVLVRQIGFGSLGFSAVALILWGIHLLPGSH